MISELLYEASAEGDFNRIKILIDNRGANPNFPYKNQSTALHAAAKYGYSDINGANVDPRDKYGFTPLMLAITQQGSLRVYGVCANVKFYSEDNDKSYETVINVLLEYKADVLARDNTGNTIIHVLAGLGLLQDDKIFKASDSLNTIGWGFLTPLHYACGTGHEKSARYLLEVAADIHARDACGWTPFHWAVKSGNLELCQLLLEYGANPNALDYRGLSPLSLSLIFHHMKIFKFLKDLNFKLKYERCLTQKSTAETSLLSITKISQPFDYYNNESVFEDPLNVSEKNSSSKAQSLHQSIDMVSYYDFPISDIKSKIPRISTFLCVFAVLCIMSDYVLRSVILINSYYDSHLQIVLGVLNLFATFVPIVSMYYSMWLYHNFFFGPLRNLSSNLLFFLYTWAYITLCYLSFKRNSLSQLYNCKNYLYVKKPDWKYEGTNAAQADFNFQTEYEEKEEESSKQSVSENEILDKVSIVESDSRVSYSLYNTFDSTKPVDNKQNKKTPWDIPHKVPFSVLDNCYMLVCEELPTKKPDPPGLVLPHLKDSATFILGLQKETSRMYKSHATRVKKQILSPINEDSEESSFLPKFDKEVFYWFCIILRYQFSQLVDRLWRLKVITEDSSKHRLKPINCEQYFEDTDFITKSLKSEETNRSLFDSTSTIYNLNLSTLSEDSFEGSLEDCWDYAVIHVDAYKSNVKLDDPRYLKFSDAIKQYSVNSNYKFQLFSVENLSISLHVAFLHMALNPQTMTTAQLLWSREFERLTTYMNRVFSQESPKDWPLITKNSNLISSGKTNSKDLFSNIKLKTLTMEPPSLYNEILQPYIQVLLDDVLYEEEANFNNQNIDSETIIKKNSSVVKKNNTVDDLAIDLREISTKKSLEQLSISCVSVDNTNISKEKKYTELHVFWLVCIISSLQIIINTVIYLIGFFLIASLIEVLFVDSFLITSMFVASTSSLTFNIFFFMVSYLKFYQVYNLS